MTLKLHLYKSHDNRISAGAKTHPESKCPELLATYCDLLLRKTPLSKKLTSEEIDEKLRSVVRISVTCISQKLYILKEKLILYSL